MGNNTTKSTYGIFMMTLAGFSFSLMVVLVKCLPHIPLMEIVFFRSFVIMITMPFVLKREKVSIWGNNKPLLLLRSILSTIATVTYFYTAQVMIMADSIAIKQLSPFFILFIAGIFLKEKISITKIIIFILAFAGALLIIRPGFNSDIYPGMVGLFGAIITAAAHVCIRKLRLTDHSLVIVNFYGYVLGIYSLVNLLWKGNFIIPDKFSIILLFLLGFVGMLAQITLTMAYRFAPTKLVSFYLYLQIIFGAIIGIIFFNEIPGKFSIFGAVLIITSGYFNYLFNKKEENK